MDIDLIMKMNWTILAVASCSEVSTDVCVSPRRWASLRCTSAWCRRRRWPWILASTSVIWLRAFWPDRWKSPTIRLSCPYPLIPHRYAWLSLFLAVSQRSFCGILFFFCVWQMILFWFIQTLSSSSSSSSLSPPLLLNSLKFFRVLKSF